MNDPFLPEELRLFVAIQLPADWTEVLRQAIHDLSHSGLSQLRWVKPEGIHLTLKFLGEVGRHLLPDLQAAMVAACEGQAPFQLSLAGLGSFGGRGGVRVVWAGVEGDMQALTGLQSRLDLELNGIGFARETRPYSPHLTLARVPASAAPDTGSRIATALRPAHLEQAGPLVVHELGLIRSQLGPGGATYTGLATARLGAAAQG